MTKIDIADLDCIYLSYDEPQKEEFWVRIRNLVPWAKRVDGIKGSDAAHKAAANASDTERFILIDGDNLPDEKFFNLTLAFPDESWEQAVFRWRARNHVNGLMYGNGGLSSWTRRFVQNMKTHENTDGACGEGRAVVAVGDHNVDVARSVDCNDRAIKNVRVVTSRVDQEGTGATSIW